MINVFDIKQDQDEQTINKFITKRVSEETQSKLDTFSDNADKLRNKIEGSPWIKTIYVFLICFGFLFIVSMLSAKDGFTNAMADRGYFLYIGIALLVVGLTILFNSLYKTKNAKNKSEVQKEVDEGNNLIKAAFDELEIPDNSIKVDVLKYLINKDNKKKQIGMFNAINFEMNLFLDGNNLCLGDCSGVASFPLDEFTEIHLINKKEVVSQWNKEVNFNSPEYKKYKVTMNQYGLVFIKGSCSLRFVHDGQEYEISFPNYEIENLTKLLSLKVVEDK